MSEINDTKELPEVTFTINLKLIQKYQRQEPIILVKHKDDTYHMLQGGLTQNMSIFHFTYYPTNISNHQE